MAGISSRALSFGTDNKYRFNGGNEQQVKDFSDGSGLALYDANFRMFDPQIGRFHQIDQLSDVAEGISPYSFALNNPILFNDPLGLAPDTVQLPEIVINGTGPAPKPAIAPPPTDNIVLPKPLTPTTPTPIPRGPLLVTESGVIEGGTDVISSGTSLLGGVLTIPLLLIPNKIGEGVEDMETLHLYGAARSSGDPAFDQGRFPSLLLGQDNSHDISSASSPFTHKVYEIGGWDITNGLKWVTLKYGVASMAYDTYFGTGNRRPDGQLGGRLGDALRAAYPNLIIRQFTIAYFTDKPSAHEFEGFMVSAYRRRNLNPDNKAPREQGLPYGDGWETLIPDE